MITITDLYQTCHALPVQFEAELSDGAGLYFRARHGAWRCTIAATIDAALSTGYDDTTAWYETTGNDDTNGWMHALDAAALIRATVVAYSAQETYEI